VTGSLGGGYAESVHDAGPTVNAVLAAAQVGDPEARLVILAGPPGSGKSTLAQQLLRLLPQVVCIDKDWTAGGFVLEAARQQGLDESEAYGHPHYWQRLRPLEYGGAVTSACANLVGRRTVLLSGGWGPELADFDLWPRLAAAIAPATFDVLHLDAPTVSTWQSRMRRRGSRAESPWFEAFAARLTATPVWPGAQRLSTDGAIHDLVQRALAALGLTPIGLTPSRG
jgi:energy-coupling factor transporter ATP-binding protein EcfA2